MESNETLYLSGQNGVQLAATSFGSEENPVVLLLHGAGQTRHSWRSAGQRLAEAGYHAVNLDTRGHGESAWPDDGDYSIDTLIADITTVASHFESLAASKPVLVGASLGGITGMLMQGESLQQHFQSLVLVDITPKIDQTGVARIIDFMNQYQSGFESLQDAAEAVGHYQSHRPQGAKAAKRNQTDGLKKNLRLADDGRYYWHWDPRLMQHIGLIDDAFYHRQRDAASKLKLPVLLIRGQQSEIVDRESVDEFLELVPHANYVDVADAAHMVAGDNNDIFIQSLLDFLAND